MACAQIQPLPAVIEQEQGTHFRFHQLARLARYDPERVVQIQRGTDGLADVHQRFKQSRLQPQLFVQPGVVNYLGRLYGQFLQQFLLSFAKGIGAIGIHI